MRCLADRATAAQFSAQRPTVGTRPCRSVRSHAAIRDTQQVAPDVEASAAKPSSMSKLLQNFNAAGTSLFFNIAWRADYHNLAVPHARVPDISWLDWAALKRAGFRACVFDKDNTLSEPFALQVHPSLVASVTACRQEFGDNLAIYSNSAGLQQYDPQGAEATKLEDAFGIHVLRHTEKKPAGGCGELEEHFGCSARNIVFIGDRILTDVVFGNRHGMLTVLVKPLTSKGEVPGVLVARHVEETLAAHFEWRRIAPPLHALLPAGAGCAAFVRDPAHTT